MKFKELKPGDIFCTKPARYMKTVRDTAIVVWSAIKDPGDEYEFADDFEDFIPIYVADEQEAMLQLINDMYKHLDSCGWSPALDIIHKRAKKILDNNGF